MTEYLGSFFYNGPFMPHGHCYLWTPGLLWLHVISDALIVFAYYSIPITLVYFVRRRRDMHFGWMFLCFAVFIVACGTTHLMEIWNVWHGNYWLAGGVKAVTALASVPTAFLLTRLVAPALKLPSLVDLEKLNVALEQEVATRSAAEEQVRAFNAELEARVRARTTELHVLNADLQRQIAERERAQEEARQSEERFRQLADAMPQIVWAARPDGFVDYYNQQWYDYTGMPEGGTGDISWEPVLHPDDLSITHEAWSRSMRTGESYEMEYRLKRAVDGAFRWHLGRACPIKDADAGIVRWFGTNTDIQDYKEAQSELLNAQQTLAERVEARTTQLAQANKELEAFSYSVSHDLRAPLRAVDGYARILHEDYSQSLDEEGNRLLKVVSSEARRMGRLVDELLAFSRLGRRALHTVRIDMNAIAADAHREAASIADSGVEFIVGDLPPATGDPTLLRQVFVNLFSNALKFSHGRPGARIEVSGRAAAKENIYRVQDNGVGFDMKYAEKLFNVFQRLHSESEFEGTGVGLAIVQRIVQRHGGRVWAEARVNEGAAFSFALPAIKETDDE